MPLIFRYALIRCRYLPATHIRHADADVAYLPLHAYFHAAFRHVAALIQRYYAICAMPFFSCRHCCRRRHTLLLATFADAAAFRDAAISLMLMFSVSSPSRRYVTLFATTLTLIDGLRHAMPRHAFFFFGRRYAIIYDDTYAITDVIIRLRRQAFSLIRLRYKMARQQLLPLMILPRYLYATFITLLMSPATPIRCRLLFCWLFAMSPRRAAFLPAAATPCHYATQQMPRFFADSVSHVDATIRLSFRFLFADISMPPCCPLFDFFLLIITLPRFFLDFAAAAYDTPYAAAAGCFFAMLMSSDHYAATLVFFRYAPCHMMIIFQMQRRGWLLPPILLPRSRHPAATPLRYCHFFFFFFFFIAYGRRCPFR